MSLKAVASRLVGKYRVVRYPQSRGKGAREKAEKPIRVGCLVRRNSYLGAGVSATQGRPDFASSSEEGRSPFQG